MDVSLSCIETSTFAVLHDCDTLSVRAELAKDGLLRPPSVARDVVHIAVGDNAIKPEDELRGSSVALGRKIKAAFT